MPLCNILKDAAQVMEKASTLKTERSKFRSGWYDHKCYTYKKKAQRSLRRYRNWRSDVMKAEYILNWKKLWKGKKEAYSSHKISTLFKSLNNPNLFWKEIRSLLCMKSPAFPPSLYPDVYLFLCLSYPFIQKCM